MRFRKKITTSCFLVIVASTSFVAGCQSTPPLSPQEQARQAEYDRENTRVALADCTSLKKNGTLQGFDERGPRLPNLTIGDIPIPIGTVVAAGQAAERTGYRNRALKAELADAVASKDAAIVVRKMMVPGFDQEETIAASRTAQFANAVFATRRARLYLETNQRKS